MHLSYHLIEVNVHTLQLEVGRSIVAINRQEKPEYAVVQ